MKKLLAILLAVTMLVTVSAFAIGASVDICDHSVGDNCGGYVVDTGTSEHYGNAYTYSANQWTTAEIYAYGITYPSQAGPTQTCNAYSLTYSGSALAHYINFSCSHSAYGGK